MHRYIIAGGGQGHLTPHRLVKLVCIDYPAPVFHKVNKKLVFLVAQVDKLSVFQHLALFGVDNHPTRKADCLAVFTVLRTVGVVPAGQGINLQEKLGRGKRLNKVVVATRIVGRHLVGIKALCREKQHGHGGKRAYLCRCLHTGKSGHHHVHYDKVNTPVLTEQGNRRRPVLRLQNLVARILKQQPDYLSYILFIINNENSHIPSKRHPPIFFHLILPQNKI